jgi:hypothetical protein
MPLPVSPSQIGLPSDTQPPRGRYDKLIAAGMATRFVKGTSGNPDGRPNRRQSGMNASELAQCVLQFLAPS